MSPSRARAGRWSALGQSSRRRRGRLWRKSAKKMNLAGYHCATLLKPGDYQLLLVEAPNVTPDELKGAIRWKIKDLIEYHIDDASRTSPG